VLDSLDEQLDTLRATGQYYKSRIKQLEGEPEPVTALGERGALSWRRWRTSTGAWPKCQAAVNELAQLERDPLGQARAPRRRAPRAWPSCPVGYDAARHAAVRARSRRCRRGSRRLRAEGAGAPRAEARARADARGALAQCARARRLRDARAHAVSRGGVRRAARRHERAGEARAAELRGAGAGRGARPARSSRRAARARAAKVSSGSDTLQREKRLHDELDRAYSDLRTDLNFQLRPSSRARRAQFLDELTDARYSSSSSTTSTTSWCSRTGCRSR
jgi:exonuclease SbcC